MRSQNTIPNELVKHTIAMCGERGVLWLEELPALIQHLEENWSIKVGKPFPSIEFNYVAEAVNANGTKIVIKISPPFENSEIFSEARFLKVLKGRGIVNLLAEDRDRRSILIERAVPGANLAELFDGHELSAIEPAIGVLRAIAGEVPDDITDIISLDDWFDNLRRNFETKFPKYYSEKALELYAELSASDVPKYYLHGDFHPGNIVSASREPFLAIDPKGIIGPLGYDIAVFLNNFHWWQEGRTDIPQRLNEAIRMFSDAFEIKPSDLRRWAFAQMVLSAWWTFDEMPETYRGDVVKADVWDI